MERIRSLADLQKIKTEALEKRDNDRFSITRVIIAMGSCGIAAGAGQTMKALLDQIDSLQLSDIAVTKSGCPGLCELEPIVQVIVRDQPAVTYGRVLPDVGLRILSEHVLEGKIVAEFVLEDEYDFIA